MSNNDSKELKYNHLLYVYSSILSSILFIYGKLPVRQSILDTEEYKEFILHSALISLYV